MRQGDRASIAPLGAVWAAERLSERGQLRAVLGGVREQVDERVG